jgi:L-ascorbate metabolism protein UlaG (beta-lactamase superfamily)
MVHADHSCGILDEGKIVYGGEACGYIIRFPGGLVAYHAGDTNVFGDMKLIAELYRPEVAMLPIGDLFTMSPREAAHAVRLLGVKAVIPMHFGTFPPLTGRPEELRELTRDIPGLEVIALKPGESIG